MTQPAQPETRHPLPHDTEWLMLLAERGEPEHYLPVRSAHGFVNIRRYIAAGDFASPHSYELLGGRVGTASTWRAVLRGCACVHPTCPKAGKVTGYRPPGWTLGTDTDSRVYGRSHAESCRAHNLCHRGIDGYNPADVVALAERALDSWAPARPVVRRAPAAVRVPYQEARCAGCGAPGELTYTGNWLAAACREGRLLCPACLPAGEDDYATGTPSDWASQRIAGARR